jgi:ABC-type multidrug transport system permease subunit
MRNHALWQLTLVRFREFLREPEALFWVLGFPLLLSAGLGLAFRNTPAEVLSIGVVGLGSTAFGQAPSLAVDPFATRDDGLRALREGRIALLVERPAEGSVVYHYDDTNPEGRDARMRADLAVQGSAGRQDPVAAQDQFMRETGSRYIDFLVPGLLGMNIMGGSIWSMGFAIVDARRRKLMKRLIATPMPRHYFLLSFLVSRLAMLILEVAAFLGFAVLVFGVPVRGSLVLVGGICVLGSLAFGAIGLLLSSRARTIEAASGLMNLTMLPMWILSGVFFSSQRFPDAVQPIIAALPLTALNDALRATMLQGATVAQIAAEAGVLAAWLLVCFPVALKLFRWR